VVPQHAVLFGSRTSAQLAVLLLARSVFQLVVLAVPTSPCQEALS
jgi:hypothetical protein